MFAFIFLGIIIAVYVHTFKDDFSDEHIKKVVPFIILISTAFILLGITGSLISR